MSEVADAAGVQKSLVGYYFPTPDSLFAEVAQLIIRDFNDYVLDHSASQASKGARDILKAYVRSFFRWGVEYPGRARLLLYFFYSASQGEPFASISASVRKVARDRLAGYIYRGVAEGDFMPIEKGAVDPLAMVIQSLILGGNLVWGTEPGVDPKKLSDQILQAILRLLEK